jgi:hypothetical protein
MVEGVPAFFAASRCGLATIETQPAATLPIGTIQVPTAAIAGVE